MKFDGRAWGFGIAGFALSLANALVALPKGGEFTLLDMLAVPLFCLLLALGNGILAGLGNGNKKEEKVLEDS